MKKISIAKTLCSQHEQPIVSICCSNHCQGRYSACHQCFPLHKGHQTNLKSIDDFAVAVIDTVLQQNQRDVEAMKKHDTLQTGLYKHKKIYDHHQELLLTTIIRILEAQKSSIIQKIQQKHLDEHNSNIKFLDKLNRKKLLAMRIKLSSQKGFAYFTECLDEATSEKSEARTSLEEIDMAGTLTAALKNFIKLKVSKSDAEIISQSTILQTTKAVKDLGAPPLSPRKKCNQEAGKDNLKLAMKPC